MSRRTYSGRVIVKVLVAHGFKPHSRKGSHVQLRYENEDTGEVRNVTVPMKDELPTGTLRSIADQAGANDFEKFLDWIDDNL